MCLLYISWLGFVCALDGEIQVGDVLQGCLPGKSSLILCLCDFLPLHSQLLSLLLPIFLCPVSVMSVEWWWCLFFLEEVVDRWLLCLCPVLLRLRLVVIILWLELFGFVRYNLRSGLGVWGRRFGRSLCTWVRIIIRKAGCFPGLPGIRGVRPMLYLYCWVLN